MFRRVLSCALLALVLVRPTVAPAESPVPPVPPTPPQGYSVSYREAGSLEWKQERLCPEMKDAVVVARGLHNRGYEVEVLSRFAIRNLPPSPRTGTLPLSETVSSEKVQQVFNWLANQRDIAYRFPGDGCYARAHLMIRRLKARGFRPYKVWSFANGGELLHVRTSNHPRGYVEWKYHVAPVLRVRLASGKQLWYVLDPSLFNRPVPIQTWKLMMKRRNASYEPYSVVTHLGQAPKDPRGTQLPGSGYWPGKDPRDIDQHAMQVMQLYKPYEGRIPPARVSREFRRLAFAPMPALFDALAPRREWLAAA